MSPADTTAHGILPIGEAPIVSRVRLNAGHFDIGGKEAQRIRFFGTELSSSAQFLPSQAAHILALRLHKLGFNAVRLTSNDMIWWAAASFLNYTNGQSTTSYNLIPDQLARFDTLLYEFRNAGIYVFLTLNSQHQFIAADGVPQGEPDSTQGAQFTHFTDARASELHREWAKALLSHVSPLTGLRLADEPTLAGIEVTAPGYSLLAGWRFGLLNWIDQNNAINQGKQTVCFNRSRRLDTMFTKYLLRKYGSESGITSAWKGKSVVNPPNVVDNGSFEDDASTSWSFGTQNGANGDKSLLSPGIDSDFCMWARVSSLSPAPNWSDVILLNATPRLGKDTLYELSYYAKIKYKASKPVLSRTVLVYLEQFQNYTQSYANYQTIDTAWHKYTVVFRANAGGLHRLYFGLGHQLGDVLFDGVTLRQHDEVGLVNGETSSLFTIYRLKYNETDLLPRQRVRDIALFYDSLQTDYFLKMKKCIADTIKSQVLVNFYATDWWGSIQDAYSNRYSDFTQAHINTDYPRQRNNATPYSDSTWVMSNNSILSDLYNGTMGFLSGSSIAGKPHIGRYMNLVLNQNCAAQMPFFTAYASLQDWDGLFFTSYGSSAEDLFAGYELRNSWWSMAGNPSLLVQLPQASDVFRNQKIKASALRPSTTIVHDADDILLKSLPSPSPLSLNNTGTMGVDGGLQPNIATMFQVRQQFDVPTHKVAAEYPYQYDTITKVSETSEIEWSQSGGFFITHTPAYTGIAGKLGSTPVVAGSYAIKRIDPSPDNGKEMESFMISNITPARLLVTATPRSQNYLASWQYNDSSVGNKWGGGPPIFSSATFELTVPSDSAVVVAYPLDSSGNKLSGAQNMITGVKISGQNSFKITLDESVHKTPWYVVEMTSISASVSQSGGSTLSCTVVPNPALGSTRAIVELPNFGSIKIALFDDLGRELLAIANGELSSGKYEFPFSVNALATGHYILRIESQGNVIARSVNVVK